MRKHLLLAAASFAAIAFSASAQPSGQSPTPVPMPPVAQVPQDTPYPGVIQLDVDATDIAHSIFRIHETVPVSGGPITLLFPRWLPGDHGPDSEIEKLAGLVVTANGHVIPWRRDPVDISAFHVDVPAGVSSLDLQFQFLSATDDSQGQMVVARNGMQLEWNSMLLYPAGHYASQIKFHPSVKLPEGWGYAAALGNGTAGAAPVQFGEIDLNNLIDSPLYAGRYFSRTDIDTAHHQVFLDLIGDRADQIHFSPTQIAAHRNLVTQTDRLFGARHYDHYDFLLSVSDRLNAVGLEHHRSSENGTPSGYFNDWDNYTYERDLLPHEMTHSWNGKYRRPADLWIPDFNTPMRDSLLWVYEGQTQYWGQVLAARSGLWTKQNALDSLATVAATYDGRPGRHWRPLQDTTNDPVVTNRAPLPWRSYQRSEDYYEEGQMIWLEADTLIRERTHGAKSLDNFARLFFGQHNGDYAPVTYTFDDVVTALNTVMPYDWAKFLHDRLDTVRDHAPIEGLTRAGYRLVFNDTRSDFLKAYETERKRTDFMFSLGFSIGEAGAIAEVMWDSPAFNAGVTVGATLVAVNGESYDADELRRLVTEAKTGHDPIQLLIKVGDHYQTVALDYHGGLRYPHLERIRGTPDRLSQILAPRH